METSYFNTDMRKSVKFIVSYDQRRICIFGALGLAKDHGGHLVNQPRISLFARC